MLQKEKKKSNALFYFFHWDENVEIKFYSCIFRIIIWFLMPCELISCLDINRVHQIIVIFRYQSMGKLLCVEKLNFLFLRLNFRLIGVINWNTALWMMNIIFQLTRWSPQNCDKMGVLAGIYIAVFSVIESVHDNVRLFYTKC